MNLRRVAANIVIDKDGHEHKNHVIELYNSHVVNFYPLEGEIPMTEWLGGVIIIEGGKAYHIKTDADGIRHKQQL